ncbi:NAD(P)-dependent oxidoreductase [Clostridium sp. DJ247]|uniref:NAD-dependent epimerase/dehydratase family protein n=1 Tax=Clostridium sp. DJ247 TaxID=2726188 RepID=UPI001628A1D3|nr:NAD(P)-dependent oxidoreductase [Clostridium sp. DJ247]MBC2582113.1 NAD(P)-dependent oxidoreductase [Clostridium sp. DJ247]
MKVVVTGAAGKIGRWTVRTLLEAGHDVIATDRLLTEESATKSFIQSELRNYGQVCQLIMQAEAVVHLANIPSDVRNTPQAIFENNMLVNFNILEACKDFNIQKLVWASSETVFGFPFTSEQLHFVPIDEEHPLFPRSSYAMAKVLTEELSKMYYNLVNKQIVVLRFANIYEPDEYTKIPVMHWTDEQKDKQKMNVWAYCDVRDAAQACLLALEKDNLGNQVFNITAADTIMPDLSADLVKRFFPEVPFKYPVNGNETLMSINKARQVLGYAPKYSWRNVLNEDGTPKPMPEDLFALANV